MRGITGFEWLGRTRLQLPFLSTQCVLQWVRQPRICEHMEKDVSQRIRHTFIGKTVFIWVTIPTLLLKYHDSVVVIIKVECREAWEVVPSVLRGNYDSGPLGWPQGDKRPDWTRTTSYSRPWSRWLKILSCIRTTTSPKEDNVSWKLFQGRTCEFMA